MRGGSCCDATARHFDREVVEREARALEEKGLPSTTSTLVELLLEHDVRGESVLDVGGGLGAASEALIDAGASRATVVEASKAYAEAARERGLDPGRVEYRVGDFVEVAEELETADIVVLDRVICCDPRLQELLGAAASRTGRLLAASYPRDRLLVRAVIALQNLGRRLKGDDFRVVAHPVDRIRRTLARRGLRLRGLRRSFVWETASYERV